MPRPSCDDALARIAAIAVSPAVDAAWQPAAGAGAISDDAEACAMPVEESGAAVDEMGGESDRFDSGPACAGAEAVKKASGSTEDSSHVFSHRSFDC